MSDNRKWRVIKCTKETAPAFREVIKQWPELDHLVSGLREQGVFPGLKGLQIAIETGDRAADDPLSAALAGLERATKGAEEPPTASSSEHQS